MTIQELLPSGVYPIWSPYDSFEAADALMKALAEEEQGQTSAALQEELADANPDLLAAALPAYAIHIASLQAEIAEYLHANPTDISQIAAALPAEALAQ
jgi:hypothetical protein